MGCEGGHYRRTVGIRQDPGTGAGPPPPDGAGQWLPGDMLEDPQVPGAGIFDDCDWVDDFSRSNQAAAYARDDRHRIEQTGGTWGSTMAAQDG